MSEAWEKFETHVRWLVSGKKTPASGRLGMKGDIHTQTLVIECKLRTFPSSAVWGSPDPDWLSTVVYQATKAKKLPVLAYRRTFKSEEPDEDFYYCRCEDFTKLTGLSRMNTGKTRLYRVPDGWMLIFPEELTAYCRLEGGTETYRFGPFTKKEPPRRGFQRNTIGRSNTWAKRPFGKRNP